MRLLAAAAFIALVAVLGARVEAQTVLSGTIKYTGSRGQVLPTTPIKLFLAVYNPKKNPFDKAITTTTVSTNGGAFVLSAPAGTYSLAYKLELIPDTPDDSQHLGEPFQFYDQEFMRGQWDPISLPASGVSLMFDDTAIISGVAGTVTYTGSLALESSNLEVDAFTDPGLTACAPTCFVDFATAPVTGGRYDLPDTGSVFYLRAFLDINGNQQLDPGEPFQIYQNKCSGSADPVVPGIDQTNINFSFGDESLGPCNTPSPNPTTTPTPTVTTSTPTPTMTSPPAACVGDCDASGSVTVDEILTLVNIALGTAQLSACPDGVPSGDEVNIALILTAVNNALNGCGA
ncbi:MAG TPA: hypothetical protein VN812_23865 [Candidatus Acidoferrales bacterium]|nr:hypothetical protein [Candidatus Acidoferrales bacterium]